MKRIAAISLLTVIGLSTTLTFASQNFSYSVDNNSYNENSLQGSVTYVPQGTTFKVTLDNSLSSESTILGSTVRAILTEDFIYKNVMVAPVGSVVTGSVVKVQKATAGSRNGQIQVVFNNITTPYGKIIPINGAIKTNDNTGILKGGTAMDTTKDFTKNAVIGAGVGAALGTAMGALSGGSVGKGAIYGTAIGGGLGVAKEAITKGENVSVPQGAYVDIFLLQSVNVAENNY